MKGFILRFSRKDAKKHLARKCSEIQVTDRATQFSTKLPPAFGVQRNSRVCAMIASSTIGSAWWPVFLWSFLVVNWCSVIVWTHADEMRVRASEEGRITIDGATGDGAAADSTRGVSTQRPILGGFKIINNLPANTLLVVCHNKDSRIQRVRIQPNCSWDQSFDVHQYVWPWQCNFEWRHGGHIYLLSFDVWNHDGIYGFLFDCDLCIWSVRSDGFYILKDDSYYLIWDWLEFKAKLDRNWKLSSSS